MIRHEIMVTRTKAEIDQLAAEMAQIWKESGRPTAAGQKQPGPLKARALALIFQCLPGSRTDYKEAMDA